ncbi:MAG: amino acid permease [Pirellulaceae bacterium]
MVAVIWGRGDGLGGDVVDQPATLKRSLGLPLLTFYGLGTIVGGGFYALVGKVAVEAGMLTPLAFLAASLIAMFSAFSYAELSARYPYSAGEAHYALVAFRRLWPSAIVGWAVIATGVVSAATLADALAGFVRTLVDVPEWLVVCAMLTGLGLIAVWGIGESAWLALVITVVELGGLVVVMIAGADSLPTLGERWRELTPGLSLSAWSGVLLGAHLAFYSFIGFEDLVNVAEEVKRPSRNLPIAILASLALTSLLYVVVSTCLVLSVEQSDLHASGSPLALVFGEGSRLGAAITVVGMLSGLNGALVQIVMASRVAYGMARQGQAPRWLSWVSPSRRTPLPATIAITLVALVLALWLPIVALAKATSTILLLVYAVVNVSLIVIRLGPDREAGTGPRYPLVIPIIGAATCLGFVVFQAVMLLAA